MQITEDIRDYWNKRSSGFSDAIMDEYSSCGRQITDTILEMTDTVPGSKALDVGCGPGLLSMLLHDAGMDVIGIDYSEEMVRMARKNASGLDMGISFERMDAQQLDFPDNTFDLVVSRDVLWNLPEPERAYEEIVRVLKPKGKAFVKDGNYYIGLTDDRYARRHEACEMGRDHHSEYNQDGVDFNIILEIAKELPLTAKKRPAWDMEVLQDLGIEDIRMRLQHFRTDDRSLVSGFSISFTKAGCP